ncbi:MAG TPA: class I SAM-dependent methyltransferase [Syntrophales bacterium]|nr:class I SAM-dependent methyltransferase [Syntrophales bacterium]HOL59109.1 class I SAM-dependent methyltransferase [Syntrophales bacterium]
MEQKETGVSCPHCGWPSRFDFIFYERSYYHCTHCDLIFHRPERKEDAQRVLDYYRKRYFDEHAQDQLSGERKKIYRHALDLIERFQSPGKLLDVGCGIGQLLKEALARGWDVLGVDPSEKSIAYARGLIGDRVVCGTLDDIKETGKFDCVTLINVLDHMVDGGRQLRKTYHLLKEGGMIYLRLPNGFFYSRLRRLSSKYRWLNAMNRYLVFHEYVVTPVAIRRCLADYGYKDIMVGGDRLSFVDCRQHMRLPTHLVAFFMRVFFWGAKLLEIVSRGRLVLSPSMWVVAWKK